MIDQLIWKIASSVLSTRTKLSSSIRRVLFVNVCCVSLPTMVVPLPEVIAGNVNIRVLVPVPTLLTSNLAFGP